MVLAAGGCVLAEAVVMMAKAVVVVSKNSNDGRSGDDRLSRDVGGCRCAGGSRDAEGCRSDALWDKTAMNQDVSTGPLARLFARGRVNDWMAILSVFFSTILRGRG